MPTRVFVLWRDDESYDFIDVLCEADWRDGSSLVHDVRGPKGEVWKAVCRVRVADRHAEFDYGGEFKKKNEDAGMCIGIMRFDFGEPHAITVSWKPLGASNFEVANAIALRETELKRLCFISQL